MVYLSVGLLLCQSVWHDHVPGKTVSRSRCRFDGGLGWTQVTMYYMKCKALTEMHISTACHRVGTKECTICAFGKTHMGRKLGRGFADLGGAWSPSNTSNHVTQCRMEQGLPHNKWHLGPSSRLATTDMDQKLAMMCTFGERLGPHSAYSTVY